MTKATPASPARPTPPTSAGPAPGPPPGAWDSGDPLGETLHALRMNGVVYTRSHLTAPWGVILPPMPDCVMFHVVTAGQCRLEAEGDEPLTLRDVPDLSDITSMGRLLRELGCRVEHDGTTTTLAV